MTLLPLLAVAAVVLKCSASLLPGLPPPEIVDRQDLPPPGPWENDFELTNPRNNPESEELFESDILLTEAQWEAFRERKAIDNDESRWPDGSDGYPLVPFLYNDSSVDREAVAAGISHWMEHTCIKFEETTETNQAHLKFFQGGGCWSYVGVISSTGQLISIGQGCTSLEIVAHEIGHAIGFWHEQSRTDRDDYLVIKYDNIVENLEHNFAKHETNNYDVKYDYGSDMHYGSFFFSKNGKMTIVTKDPFAQELIASALGLSHRDKLLANKMYKCIDKWMLNCGIAADPCKNEGYIGADCKCVCPPGTSGTNCNTDSADYYAHLRSEHTETITTEKTISHVGGSKFTKKIVAPTCKKVKLTFSQFDLYEKLTHNGATYCYYEFIFLRLGQDLTEGKNYCEQDITAGQSFTSETDTMILYHVSCCDWLSDGWTAKIEFVSDPECSSETLVECAKKPKTQNIKAGESIQIQSPKYPNNYPTMKCGWKLKGDGAKKVKVSCSNFGMEAPNKKGKCKDFLQVGTKKYCGENGPVDVTVSVKKLANLKFKSNKKKFKKGFSCTVTAQ